MGNVNVHEKVKKGKFSKVKRALEHGYPLEDKDKDGRTLLMNAALAGNDRVIQLLISRNVPLDTTNIFDYTALHFACNANKPTVVKMLLQAGADPSKKNRHGRIPEEETKNESIRQIFTDLGKSAMKKHPPEGYNASAPSQNMSKSPSDEDEYTYNYTHHDDMGDNTETNTVATRSPTSTYMVSLNYLKDRKMFKMETKLITTFEAFAEMCFQKFELKAEQVTNLLKLVLFDDDFGEYLDFDSIEMLERCGSTLYISIVEINVNPSTLDTPQPSTTTTASAAPRRKRSVKGSSRPVAEARLSMNVSEFVQKAHNNRQSISVADIMNKINIAEIAEAGKLVTFLPDRTNTEKKLGVEFVEGSWKVQGNKTAMNLDVVIKKFKFSESQLKAAKNIIWSQVFQVNKKISHENILSCLGYVFHTAQKKICLVFEKLPGTMLSLRDYLKQIPYAELSWKQRIIIAKSVTAAVHYLHCQQKVCTLHKRLNSLAVAISKEEPEQVKIFEMMLTPLSRRMGGIDAENYTIRYFAPEILSSLNTTKCIQAPHEIWNQLDIWTAKSDVYALGMIFYELLLHQMPYESHNCHDYTSMLAVLSQQQNLVVNTFDFSSVAKDCPSSFVHMMLLCLSVDPKRRPSTQDLLNTWFPKLENEIL